MYSHRLRRALGYRKFGGETPRLLVLDTGYFVVRDVLDAAGELGWSVDSVTTPREGAGDARFLADLMLAIARGRPDFVLTINHLGFDAAGVLAGVLHQYDIPTASWFVDHPLPILGGATGNATPSCQVFCFERTAIPWLQSQGFEAPAYLPTASNARLFRPGRVEGALVEQLRGPVTFAGNSWWCKARVEPAPWALAACRSFCRRHRVDRRALASGLVQALEREPSPGPRGVYALAQVVLAEASVRTRGRFARALRPVGLRVHGDRYWERLCPGVARGDFLDYGTALPALFAASAINANVTAEQMPTAVNQRVWDVPAVGGFLLTDAQQDALEFFVEDEEIVVYRDLEECADKARHYLQRPARRAAIAQRARVRVEARHRYTHRLQQMACVMRRRFGSATTRPPEARASSPG